MSAMQLPVDFPEVQAVICRVALSLDSFLVNGIPYGVIQREFFNGFLQKTASNLLGELASLEQQSSQAPVSSQPRLNEALAALRANCQELIDLLTGLSSFRSLPIEQLRAAVAKIPPLREACVQRIQELEQR